MVMAHTCWRTPRVLARWLPVVPLRLHSGCGPRALQNDGQTRTLAVLLATAVGSGLLADESQLSYYYDVVLCPCQSFACRRPQPIKFVSFDSGAAHALESAYKSGQVLVQLTVRGTAYQVDLMSMVQTNLATGYTRTVQRTGKRSGHHNNQGGGGKSQAAATHVAKKGRKHGRHIPHINGPAQSSTGEGQVRLAVGVCVVCVVTVGVVVAVVVATVVAGVSVGGVVEVVVVFALVVVVVWQWLIVAVVVVVVVAVVAVMPPQVVTRWATRYFSPGSLAQHRVRLTLHPL